MSEEQVSYLPMEQQARQLEQRLQAISTDPTASYWLKRAASELWERDVVDALNDLDVLRELLAEKRKSRKFLLEK